MQLIIEFGALQIIQVFGWKVISYEDNGLKSVKLFSFADLAVLKQLYITAKEYLLMNFWTNILQKIIVIALMPCIDCDFPVY